MRIAIVVLVVVFLSIGGGVAQQPPPSPPNDGNVKVQMRNVMYHFQDNIAVHIRRLGGELVPTKPGQIPVFDDKQSFTLRVDAAEMAMTPGSLANVLNEYVFARKDAPVKDVSIMIEKDRLKVKGKLHKQGDVSFETENTLSATADGKIRLHAEKVKALHLPVKGLMDLFGVEIADLIKAGKVPGVQAERDDLILDPEQALPPPHIKGKVTQVRIEGGNIVQVFGEPQVYKWAPAPATNYMAYRGNRLKFGKLTMEDTDLLLIDADPRDPFDFYLDRYKEQLMAGYSKTTATFGLRVFMLDLNKLGKAARKAPTQAKLR